MPLEDPHSGPPQPPVQTSTAPPARPADRDLETELLDLVARTREQASEDPFRNPVLAVTLAITRRLDRDEIGESDLDALLTTLLVAAALTIPVVRERERRLSLG